jgi:hypothetical protein
MDQSQQSDQQEDDDTSASSPPGAPSLKSLAKVIQSALADGTSAEAGTMPTTIVREPLANRRRTDFAGTMESVRRVSETLRAAQQRSNELQAMLQAVTDRAERAISAAEERAQTANERADAAEERARQSEERLSQIMDLIQYEFASDRTQGTPQARLGETIGLVPHSPREGEVASLVGLHPAN